MKECCKNTERRLNVALREDLTVGICLDCGRRHFELTADPGVIGITGAKMG